MDLREQSDQDFDCFASFGHITLVLVVSKKVSND